MGIFIDIHKPKPFTYEKDIFCDPVDYLRSRRRP